MQIVQTRQIRFDYFRDELIIEEIPYERML